MIFNDFWKLIIISFPSFCKVAYSISSHLLFIIFLETFKYYGKYAIEGILLPVIGETIEITDCMWQRGIREQLTWEVWWEIVGKVKVIIFYMVNAGVNRSCYSVKNSWPAMKTEVSLHLQNYLISNHVPCLGKNQPFIDRWYFSISFSAKLYSALISHYSI